MWIFVSKFMSWKENYIQAHIKICKATRGNKKRGKSDRYWKRVCARKHWRLYEQTGDVRHLDSSTSKTTSQVRT